MGSISGGSLRVELKASGTPERPGKRGGVALGSGALDFKVDPTAGKFASADIELSSGDIVTFPGAAAEVDVVAGSPTIHESYSISDFEGVAQVALGGMACYVIEVLEGAVQLQNFTGDTFALLQAGHVFAAGSKNTGSVGTFVRLEGNDAASRVRIDVIGF